MTLHNLALLLINLLLAEDLVDSILLEELVEFAGTSILILLILVDEDWSQDQLVQSLHIEGTALPVLSLLLALDLVVMVVLARLLLLLIVVNQRLVQVLLLVFVTEIVRYIIGLLYGFTLQFLLFLLL